VRFLVAFGRFWYDFIIGDDWKIAVAVVSALALAVLALTLDLMSEHLLTVVGALLVMAAFSISLVIDVREK
jgi:hypothetical protein